jgi:hypothetical protein
VYSEYFTAAAHFLTARGILPEIGERKACAEEDLARAETRIGGAIPAELRAYYNELGDWFSFRPELEQNGFRVALLTDLHSQQDFAQEIMEEAEYEIRSLRPRNDPEALKAEAERRAHWFPFYNIGGGGYLLCLDTARNPSPVFYHEAVYWRAHPPSLWTFELAPSFAEFLRQWSRFCFSDPGCSLINFCMDRHGAFDWAPRHLGTKYDRGTTKA